MEYDVFHKQNVLHERRSDKSENKDLTKLRRRRQQERQKSNWFNEQNDNSARAARFFVHFLPSLHNEDVKWPNFKFTWERKLQGDKFYHLCQNSGAVPSLQL